MIATSGPATYKYWQNETYARSNTTANTLYGWVQRGTQGTGDWQFASSPPQGVILCDTRVAAGEPATAAPPLRPPPVSLPRGLIPSDTIRATPARLLLTVYGGEGCAAYPRGPPVQRRNICRLGRRISRG